MLTVLDISSILDLSPAFQAHYDLFFHNVFAFPISVRLDIILRRLAFSHSSFPRRLAAVSNSWRLICDIQSHLSATFDRVVAEARNRHGALSACTTRVQFLQWTLLWWMNALEGLHHCHQVLISVPNGAEEVKRGLRRTSIGMLDAALVEVARALGVILVRSPPFLWST